MSRSRESAAGVSGYSPGGVKLPSPDQIGIVVKDTDRAIEFFSSAFGWGPFKIHVVDDDGFTFHGEKGRARLKLAMAQIGRLEIELIEVLEGETVHSEFLREKGEGIHHIRFRVHDIDAEISRLEKYGLESVYYHMVPGRTGYDVAFAYMSTENTSGVMIELLEERMTIRRKIHHVVMRTNMWMRLRSFRRGGSQLHRAS
jgi:methylmalonyl-CoA/ethylmalonyl-CoA epimerase